MDIKNNEKIKNFYEDVDINELDYIVNNYGRNEMDTFYLVNPKKQLDMYSNIYKNLDLPKGSKILEFGPGAGYGMYVGLKYGYDIWGIDIDQISALGIYSFDLLQKLLGIQNRIYFYDGVGEFPFKDNEFNALLSKNAIHHTKTSDGKSVKDLNKTKNEIYWDRFKEISRILKPKSKLYIKSIGRSKLSYDTLARIGNPKKLEVMCWHEGIMENYKNMEKS